MLSDEEKKAYDNLIMLKYFTQENEDKKAIQIILDLIEKQQKEIEELKENNGYNLGFIDGRIAKKYEYQDKIKAKIEEVNAGELNLAFIISGVEYKEAITSALQSLLEKE